jgi:hypothetical protein
MKTFSEKLGALAASNREADAAAGIGRAAAHEPSRHLDEAGGHLAAAKTALAKFVDETQNAPVESNAAQAARKTASVKALPAAEQIAVAATIIAGI